MEGIPMSNKEKLLLDRKTAADMLGVSYVTLDRLVKNGELCPRRIGSRVLFPRCELIRFAYADKATA
jgi:excisionase family DNA binding protein